MDALCLTPIMATYEHLTITNNLFPLLPIFSARFGIINLALDCRSLEASGLSIVQQAVQTFTTFTGYVHDHLTQDLEEYQ